MIDKLRLLVCAPQRIEAQLVEAVDIQHLELERVLLDDVVGVGVENSASANSLRSLIIRTMPCRNKNASSEAACELNVISLLAASSNR